MLIRLLIIGTIIATPLSSFAQEGISANTFSREDCNKLMEKQSDELNMLIQKCEQSKEMLTSELNQLNADYENLKAENAVLEDKNEELDKQKNMLEDEKKALIEEVSELNASYIDLEKENDELEEENEALEDMIENLKKKKKNKKKKSRR